jgi:hypothetical protein
MSEQLTDTTSDHLANHLIERLDPADEEQLKESFRRAGESETLTENRKNWAKTFTNPQMENL